MHKRRSCCINRLIRIRIRIRIITRIVNWALGTLVFGKKVGTNYIDCCKKNFDQKSLTELLPPKKRIIKSKGGVSTRTYKRQVGGGATVIEITRATKSLLKGGMGGRISSADTDWNYFTNIKTVISYPLSPAERVERNRGMFINIHKIQQCTAATIKEEPVQVFSDSYHVGC